ncbi:hypothetical protein FF36_05339 [Frankia torreyi]|uniref:Uncharacterized protein n=1 Tax=Frankia torreyi TaxID=1856 RepID=A0A0D8B8E8_9ACTN|nr:MULTISPECIES: hypothetical protein [Frankia]KJE20365.1 hypothetical protein FF36_05339 [Frankia torreyi]
MTEQTSPADAAPYAIHLDIFPTGAAFACGLCHASFRAHVVPLRYPTGDLTAGQWICRPCLAAGSARLASVAESLDLIAVAAAGSDQVLAIAQQAVSSIRRATEAHAIDTMAHELYGPGSHQPTIVDLGSSPITDESDLYVGAHLADGKPQVTLVDRGGWSYFDGDADAAIEAADRIRDLAEVARMAAGFGPDAGPTDPDDEAG